jgi:threonylcarbamoyladenosine tRNA methylthiotransferase MtaB
VVVAGCYSQVSVPEIAGLPGVDLIVGTREKFGFWDLLPRGKQEAGPKIVTGSWGKDTPAFLYAADFSFQTRAFLKIQDGCSRFCSYCIVPLTRGPARSVP